MNIGKIYIFGKVLEQGSARLRLSAISTDWNAPSGENMLFEKMAKLKTLENYTFSERYWNNDVQNHVYEAFPSTLAPLEAKIRVWLFLEKCMFSPLGAPQSIEIAD